MSESHRPFPDFDRPPVAEVALSVQFDPLATLDVPRIGMYWVQHLRPTLPNAEQQPPLEPAFEAFGPSAFGAPGFRVQFVTSPPVPRCWFLNDNRSRLLQLQPDRLIWNWRREHDQTYPRYGDVRQGFVTEYERLTGFLEQEQLGAMNVNQCEVTYVNHIEAAPDLWDRFGDVGAVFAPWSGRFSDEFLGEPEDVTINERHRIELDEQPIGRLHVSLQPAVSSVNGNRLFLLTLLARGRPLGTGLAGALSFFDVGREHIVRSFCALTTPAAQAHWGRRS